jgi:predicted DNA-binding transcriptional regulator AlpA
MYEQGDKKTGADSPGLLRGGWYSTEELADMLGVDSSTIRRWRTARPAQGPPFVRLSSRVTLYSARDVERWLARRRVDPEEAA